MDILLTNDDGIHALGLRALYTSLVQKGHNVQVVAPMTEQSAVGHAVTLSMPLRVKKIVENGFVGLGVTGTPVDCVKLAIGHLLQARPDMVISGINSGANVGVDILYSGTVSAATEGALAGIPSIAASVDDFSPTDLSKQAEFIADLVQTPAVSNLDNRRVLNVNFPMGEFAKHRGVRVCSQTDAVYKDWYHEKEDPRGGKYYWLSGEIPKEEVAAGTDRALLTEGYITLTPLVFAFTDEQSLATLEKEAKNLSFS